MSDDNQHIIPPEIVTEQHSRQSTFEARRKRGGCLTIILLFFTITTFQSVYFLFKSLTHPVTAYDRSIFPFISLIFIVVDLISLYGIWRWKKWGVKSLVTAYIIGTLTSIINVMTLHSYKIIFKSPSLILNVITAISILIGLAIAILIFTFFYLEVKKRWQYFS